MAADPAPNLVEYAGLSGLSAATGDRQGLVYLTRVAESDLVHPAHRGVEHRHDSDRTFSMVRLPELHNK